MIQLLELKKHVIIKIMIPTISETDFQKLDEVLEKKQSHYKRFLKELMQKYRRVKDNEISIKTVRLNSVVELWHSVLNKVIKIKIVLPSHENLNVNNLSFFSPISMALIGYTENDLITLPSHGMKKTLRIIKVTNH